MLTNLSVAGLPLLFVVSLNRPQRQLQILRNSPHTHRAPLRKQVEDPSRAANRA